LSGDAVRENGGASGAVRESGSVSGAASGSVSGDAVRESHGVSGAVSGSIRADVRAATPQEPTSGAAPGPDDAVREELRSAEWVVVVPLKPAAVGKSRLRDGGEQLVRAIGLDTVAAASAAASVARVIVVTADPATAAAAAALPRVEVVPEPRPSGLNAAIATGIVAAGSGPRAALLGDLPALRPADLEAALRAAASVDRAVVPDAEGTGSTLVTARAGVGWSSAFGAESFARHTALGCVPLPVPAASTLRRDVDTAEQLAHAAALGLGPRTTALLAAR
jgi:2-phospho-L-lactate guanylyltransferase